MGPADRAIALIRAGIAAVILIVIVAAVPVRRSRPVPAVAVGVVTVRIGVHQSPEAIVVIATEAVAKTAVSVAAVEAVGRLVAVFGARLAVVVIAAVAAAIGIAGGTTGQGRGQGGRKQEFAEHADFPL